MRTVIKNGTIITGDGSAPFRSDVLLEDGLIKEISDSLPANAAVLDADGLIVCPGFIDPHRHLDYEISRNPSFGLIELSQGITTVLGGNCGMSGAPATEEWRDYIFPCLGAGSGPFDSFPSFMDALNHPLAVDAGFFIGMGSVTSFVKGMENRAWNDEMIAKAQDILVQAMEYGAAGVSLGIMYEPECFSSEDDYVRILSSVSRYGRPIVAHIRSEGNSMVEAVREVISIARRTGLSLVISHFKVFGKRNWNRLIDRAIELVDESRKDGLDVSIDFYPYAAGSTTMLTLIPPSVQKESWDKTIAYLDTDEGRVTFASEIMKESSWDNMVQSIGWDRVLLSSESSAEYWCFLGKDFSEIASLSWKSESDIFIDILKAENGKAGVIVRSMAESDVDKVASLDFSALISDSLYSGSESPHPRLYGSFPRFIADFSLGRKVLPIEKAIWKMTGLTAGRYGLSDRGLIRNGYKADIVIFSPDEIMDNATYTHPVQLPSGIKKVLINGEVVMDDNKILKNDEGHLLRFGR